MIPCTCGPDMRRRTLRPINSQKWLHRSQKWTYLHDFFTIAEVWFPALSRHLICMGKAIRSCRGWKFPQLRKNGGFHGIGPFLSKLAELGKKTENLRKTAELLQNFPFFLQKFHFLARTERLKTSVMSVWPQVLVFSALFFHFVLLLCHKM